MSGYVHQVGRGGVQRNRWVVGWNAGELSDVRRGFRHQSLRPLQQKHRC